MQVTLETAEGLLRRLSMYKLRARVEVAADDRPVFAAWPDAPAGFIPDPRTPLMGGRLYGEAIPDASEADYDANRLSVGLPDPAADAQPQRIGRAPGTAPMLVFSQVRRFSGV